MFSEVMLFDFQGDFVFAFMGALTQEAADAFG